MDNNIRQFPTGGRDGAPRVYTQGAAKTIVTREMGECCLRIAQSLNVDLVPRGSRLWHIRDMLWQTEQYLRNNASVAKAAQAISGQLETSMDAARRARAAGQREGWRGNLWRAVVCRRVLKVLATLEWANKVGKMPAPGALRAETRAIIDTLHRELCTTLVNQPGALASVATALLQRHLPPEIVPSAAPLPASGETLFSVVWEGQTRDLYLREE